MTTLAHKLYQIQNSQLQVLDWPQGQLDLKIHSMGDSQCKLQLLHLKTW